MSRVTRCTVCGHPALEAIDRELVAGKPAAELARRFDLHERAIQRHCAEHLPTLLMQATEVATIARARDLRGQVEGILTELHRRAAGAGEDTDAYLRCVDRLVRAFELFGRLTGELAAGSTVNINVACVTAFGMPEAEVRKIIDQYRQSMTIEDATEAGVALLKWCIGQEPERRAAMLEALAVE